MESNRETHRRPRSSATPWLLFLLSTAALGAVLYFGWDVWSKERARSEAAENAATEAAARLAAEEASRRGLEERVKAMEGEKAALSQSMTELSADLQEKEAELAKLRATYDSLNDRMQAEIKKGEIKLTQSEGRIKVDLVDKVLFDSGKAELSPRGVEVLTRLAGVLGQVDDKQIQVAGHTDDSPIMKELKERYATNWELSVARAVNVVRFLTEKGKVPSKRLVAAGHGEFQPVAANATPQGRAQNRRIEILLTPVLAGSRVGAKPAKAAAPAPAKKRSVKTAAAPRRR